MEVNTVLSVEEGLSVVFPAAEDVGWAGKMEPLLNYLKIVGPGSDPAPYLRVGILHGSETVLGQWKLYALGLCQ